MAKNKITINQMWAAAKADYHKQHEYDAAYNRQKEFVKGAKWAIKLFDERIDKVNDLIGFLKKLKSLNRDKIEIDLILKELSNL